MKKAKTKEQEPADGIPSIAIQPSWNRIDQSQPNPLISSGRGSRRGLGWWIALALVPFFALAGYWIVLETSMGQLVIESEIADIQVKILKEGKEVQGLSLHPGANVSRMLIDRYEIVLTTPSDDVLIDNGSFYLRRGETIVARVRRKEPTTYRNLSDPGSSIPNPSLAVSEATSETKPKVLSPTYENRTLQEWLETVSREKSYAVVTKSIEALTRLKDEENASVIENAVRKHILPQYPDDHSIISLLIQGPHSLERMNEEFENGDESVRTALLRYARQSLYNSEDPRFYSFLSRVAQGALPVPNSAPKLQLSEINQNQLVDILWELSRIKPEYLEPLSTLQSKNWIYGLRYFLNQPLDTPQPSKYLPMFQKRIAEILNQDDLDPQAELYLLSILPSVGIGNDPDIRLSFRSGLVKRLHHYCDQLDTTSRFSDIEFTKWAGSGSVIKTRATLLGPFPKPFYLVNGGEFHYPALLVLQSQWLLKPDERSHSLITFCNEATQARYDKVLKKLNSDSFADSKKIRILFPELRCERPGIGSGDMCHYLIHVTSGAMLNQVEYKTDITWNPHDIPTPSPSDEDLADFAELDELNIGIISHLKNTQDGVERFNDVNNDGFICRDELVSQDPEPKEIIRDPRGL